MPNGLEKTSAQIEREIDQDRQRIGEKITAIQDRLTPGQLIDEALAYAKSSGGGEYFANLGRSMKTNPLPVALMGVSLAWLMANSGSNDAHRHDVEPDQIPEDYPLATIIGEVRRVGPGQREDGRSYADFADSAGKHFRALADDAGHRAGNFIDDAGHIYRGFADAAGTQIRQIKDESGALLDDTLGWAAETWTAAKDTASNMSAGLITAGDAIRKGSASAVNSVQDQTSRLNELVLKGFREQPLVAGALAFATGAAIGAALPHTAKEDEVLGKTADEVRNEIAKQTSEVVGQTEKVAGEVYDKAAAVASDIHDTAKQRITEEAERFVRASDAESSSQSTTH